MRALVLSIFIAVCSASAPTGQAPIEISQDCVIPDLKKSYQNSIYELTVPVYKTVAKYSNVNFVFSFLSTWLMLAAIAEGSDKKTQQELFKTMSMPDDPCVRQKFYEIATTRVIPVKDVSIVQTRALLFDENLTINKTWLNFVSKNHLLDAVSAPIKSNPAITENEIKRVMVANVPRLNLTGNSVLLDALDYNGLWTTAFADAVVEQAPFYSQEGEQIGTVDLMRVKRQARMGYVKSANAKVLELPIGANSYYRMLFFILLDKTDLGTAIKGIQNNIITEMFGSLKESNVFIDIALPRMEVTGEVDVRAVFEDLGIKSIWTDPEATKYISTPSAFPSSYVQRATVILNKYGVGATPVEQSSPSTSRTGLDPEIGTEFIANQPFVFGLFDAETLSPILGVAYTQPTYR